MIMMFLNVLLTRMKMFNQVGFTCSDMSELYNDITVDISSNCICDSECHTHVISSINIHSAIKLLKSDKNDGFDGLTSDYLLNASPLLYTYLSFLFTLFFVGKIYYYKSTKDNKYVH